MTKDYSHRRILGGLGINLSYPAQKMVEVVYALSRAI
jgi:hypothetical protein